MWPWDHLALGYLALSLARRLRDRSPPGIRETVAVAFGSQFPDLVDKPLGWGTTLLPSGASLAHSLLVALPVVAGTMLVARRWSHDRVAVAFSVGYLVHLPGDVVYPMVLGSPPKVAFLLWPVVPQPASEPVSILSNVEVLLAQFVETLSTTAGQLYLLAELTVLVLAVGAWVHDGRPGLASVSSASDPR